MQGARAGRWRRLILWTTASAAVLSAGRAAEADLLYFRGGGRAQARAAEEAGRIVLYLPDRKLDLLPEDVVKRVAGYWPPDEWEPRRAAARGAGFAARFAAAWWAIENGLTIEVAPQIRELHALDPAHAPSARMAAALERLDRSCPDPDIAAFRAALGIEARVARGPHVLLLHQHDDAEAAERVAVLERVIAGFHLLFAAQGVELRAPRRRLVSAWFADRADYLAFLHGQNADAFATTSGYFHPTWGAVVACDARGDGPQKTARRALAGRRDESRRSADLLGEFPSRAGFRESPGGSPTRGPGRVDGRASPDRREREAAYRMALLDLDWRAIDLGVAAHEMVHQLAWDSGLAPRHDAFPYWLHEGLAAQFEVIRGGRWAGISRANDQRLPDWRRQSSPARLGRLIRDAGLGRGYRGEVYAQSWALVYYLRACHASAFLTFVDLLRNPVVRPDSGAEGTSDLGPESRGERVDVAFRRAFGPDLDGLERDWYRYMAGIRTPTEQHAPGPLPDRISPRPAR